MISSTILSHTSMCDRKFPPQCHLCQARLVQQDETMRYHYANAELALALGWTNIIELGGSLLGRPAAGAPDSRDQAKVPDWCGDWSASGELLAQHPVSVIHWEEHAVSATGDPHGRHVAAVADHRDRATAIRYAIVRAVTKHLALIDELVTA